MTGLIDFSVSTEENETAAPPINWREGMPSQAVNNSAREMMAALARWRDDNSGVLVASVVGGAVSLASNQGFKASHFSSAFRISFVLPQDNAGPLTLNIDNAGPWPFRRGAFDFAPGDLVAGQIYDAVWAPALSVFLLQSPTIEVPGKVAAFATVASIPSGWIECDGRALSRTVYSALFSKIGTQHGAGDNATTFNVPDLNGRTVFGRDNGKGRLTGTGGLAGTVGGVGGAETVVLSVAQLPSHGHSGSTGEAGGQAATTTGAAGGHNHDGATGGAGRHNHVGATAAAGTHSHGGSTSNAGNHVHNQGYERLSIYGGGGSLSAVSQLFPPGNNSTATGESAGVHQHSVTTDTAPDHTHPFTTSIVEDHAHGIPGAPDHAHSIPAVAAHSHSVTVNATGDGGAHPNMPPGWVGVFAIKA